MSHIFISGDAGNIEAWLVLEEGSHSAAVVCHPHPLYGGSMHDMVVSRLCEGFAAAGVSTLRFNFRGVGATDGEHDDGAGEADDVVTVSNWLRDEYRITDLYLGGYSFGAGIALRAASKIDCRAVVVVAPPLQMLEGSAIADRPMMVILGSYDQIVDCGSAQHYFAGYANVKTNVIPGADHGFMSAGEEIAALTERFIGGT